MHRTDSEKTRASGMTGWSLGIMLALIMGGCNPGGAPGGVVYGPAYIPPCTCCCGGDGFIYHQGNSALSPVSAAILHDTSGPMANYSQNHGSAKARSKSGGHK
ncbi:MAG: hypothetical protein ACYCRD_04470 [Leptospirillum sp.]